MKSELKPRSLAVNFASLLAGTTGAKILALVSVVLLSRYLGVADFGRYSLVFSFLALVNTLVDLGAGALLGREIAGNLEQPRKSIETAIYLRLLGCVIFLPPAVLLAPSIGVESQLAFAAGIGIFCAFEAFYDAWFSAAMRLDGAARARFLSGVVSLLLMVLAIFLKLGLLAVVMIGMFAPLVKLIFDYYFSGGFAIQLNAPDWQAIKSMLRDTLPLWWMGLLYIILARVDTFLLVGLNAGTGEHDLGIYAAAFRFSEMLALVIGAIAPAILPVLVRAKDTPERMGWITSIGTRVIMTGLLVACMIMFWYAPLVIGIFYGAEYAPATDCLRVLVWSQALVAVNTLAYQVLLVYNHQGNRWVLGTSMAIVVLNILLNLWLIPPYQAMGASVATVITEVAMTIANIWFVQTLTPGRMAKDVIVLPLMCALACVPVFFLGWVWGVLSVLLFGGFLFATKSLTPELVRKLLRTGLDE